MKELMVEVRQTPGEIACNFDEIAEALRNQMTAYAELQVTEDNLKERKADVATLRKIRKAVDDKRKSVKVEFSRPLDVFESRVRGIELIIDEQIARINAGLEEFEQERIDEKRANVKELYDKEIGDLVEYLPFDSIRQCEWDNKTCSDTKILSSIQEKKLKVRSDLSTIKALGSEIEDTLLKVYRESGNVLSAAVQRNTDYLEAKRAAEEKIQRDKTAQEVVEKAEMDIHPTEEKKPSTEASEDAQGHVTFRVTSDDWKKVVEILEFNGIEYEEV